MMANYQETTLAGMAYTRANSVEVSNGEVRKSISFNEERVINLDDGEVIRKPAGQVWSPFTADNALTEFALLDTTTGAETGATMTYQDLYVALYSLYLHLANERDAYVAAQEAAATEEPPAEEPAPAE